MSPVRAHIDLARRDPAYTFLLAEVDCLKPYWDAFFSWLDLARADVVLAPGREHPGDPSHPDHEHRH